MAETSPLPKIKKTRSGKNYTYKVIDSNNNAAYLEEALNEGWTIDGEGTKIVGNLIILYKEN